MNQKSETDLARAMPYQVSPARLRRMLDGEISALYIKCTMTAKASLIMDYARLGTVRDVDGGFCPKRGEWLEYIESCGRSGAYAHYQTGKLKCVSNPMINEQVYSDVFYVQERAANLVEYGLPKHVLYQVDQMPPRSFATPIVKIRIGDNVKTIRWKVQRERRDARLFLSIDNIVIKPVMDITEEEAVTMGFTPTDEPIQLSEKLTLMIDDGKTARNAFFHDYYRRFGDTLRNDPYVYYIRFNLIRK